VAKGLQLATPPAAGKIQLKRTGKHDRIGPSLPHRPPPALPFLDEPLIAPFLFFYNLAWTVALLFLRRHPRLQPGWAERTLKSGPHGPFDVWMQAASGGEALLVNMILDELAAMALPYKPLTVLATSGTQQGVDSLNKALNSRSADRVATTVAYFPFDQPSLMAKAFDRYSPRLTVIVETELWPGFLVTAAKRHLPLLLVNGRMSEKSYRSYRHFTGFFRHNGPQVIRAISAADGERFAAVFGGERVRLMSNIKFDRITPPQNRSTDNPIRHLYPANTPMVLLGSVRREEEELLLPVVLDLLARRPDSIIALFPKHLERAEVWCQRLQQLGLTAMRRSQVSERQSPGSVIVWDVFGELAGAYALATTTFVGGSLLPLGGQNFLEPLVFGLRPIIGPHWKNFAWVGRDIVTCGLVQEVTDAPAVTAALLAALDEKGDRHEFLARVHDFFEPQKGGTRQTCHLILDHLHSPRGTLP
jgi:3-deoxy-D-manno-octulosonic-acid transferase